MCHFPLEYCKYTHGILLKKMEAGEEEKKDDEKEGEKEGEEKKEKEDDKKKDKKKKKAENKIIIEQTKRGKKISKNEIVANIPKNESLKKEENEKEAPQKDPEQIKEKKDEEKEMNEIIIDKKKEDFLKVPVVVLHSALSAPQKRAGYLSVLDGSAKVVLGTRSAILSPFEFDVVIMDEEHDSSFKQQDPAPRYHTRDLAFHLAQKYGALVVLGSATPCLETFRNAKTGNLKLLTLKNRATSAPLPEVTIIDMGKVRQQKGVLMSPALREALSDCIANGDQAIILMNRRGYSKIRVCSKCGETLYCRHCHIPLVYHKQYNALMCHYCAALYPVNMPCPSCGAETYEFVGGAIEKLEEEIQEWVADAKVIRMDRDTTQNVGAVEKILNAFRYREYNILLGTQMVAKGHDFPGVKLVGIVGADSGLGIPDFRSSERLYQLLSQTAGRAGRAESGGRVFIQTLNPTEPVMQYAIRHDFEGFADLESSNRQMAFYPPFCKLVEISCGSRDESLLRDTVNRLENILRKESSLTVLGPVDAFVPKVQNVFWVKLYVKTQNLAVVRKLLSPILNAPKTWVSGVEIKVELE